ncbi:putative outer membrane colicin Js receptor [Canicola haemoglobinophilus]|uniref:Outer membrane colicin Js receptor n=1 Tax=Canicola haemoglobinophilus TaxID=733 RepID=A0AB38HA42_9PAST|nr:TonB-dependent receptor [Canicola haemoglobinophilus]STO53971.1 putative outer membrane colicin Js receptor [Canicola haemoglobinophilus]STO68504.1 putative outer membrane colicin Js receptor [Canicola haemoglobinophilus]
MQKLVVKTFVIASLVPTIAIAANKSTSQLEEIRVEDLSLSYDNENLKTYIKPGSYSYLSDKDIANLRGSSVGDFLSGVPGVIVGNKRNSGALSINIRGIANEGRVPVIVDNSEQAIPSWQGYAGSSTRTYIDPDLISNVEVEKGVSLESDGTGAIGGVVRMKTIGVKDIIPEGKDWGVRIRLGTMDNTVSPPANYTKGGYHVKYIHSCRKNAAKICEKQTYQPNARYSSHKPQFNSYNMSLALAKQWQHADVVLAYARKKQGNYFVGRHGKLPEIIGHEIEEEETLNLEGKDIEIALSKLGRDSLADITNEDKANNDLDTYSSPNYSRIFKNVDVGKIILKDNKSTLYRAGEEALNTSQDNRTYLVKVNFYNQDHRLGLGYNRYHSQFGEIMSSILNFRAFGALQGEGTEVKVDNYTLSYQYNPKSPYINLQLNGYYNKVDSSNFTPFIEEYGYSLDSRHAHFTDYRKKGFSLKNTSIFELNNKPLKLTYSMGYTKETIGMPKDAQARVKAKGYPENAIAPLYVRDGEKDEKNLFVSLNYPVLKKLTVDLGLRYTKSVSKDNKVKKEQIVGSNPPEYVEQVQKPVKTDGYSPIVMLTYKPIDAIQIYGKYAQAIRSPSLFQSTRGWSMQETSNNLEALRPEKTKSWEVGINAFFENVGHFDNVVGFKLAYFDNFIEDYLARTTNKDGKAQTSNIASAQFKGVEFAGTFDMKRFYTKLAGSYYTDAKFCLYPHQGDLKYGGCDTEVFRSNLNNQIPPKLNLNLTLGSRWLNETLDIGARYSYYSKRLVPVNSAYRFVNTSSIDWNAYSLVDIYVNYQVNKNLKLLFNIDNVFNRYYLDANNMGLNTAPGRTMRFSIDYRF